MFTTKLSLLAYIEGGIQKNKIFRVGLLTAKIRQVRFEDCLRETIPQGRLQVVQHGNAFIPAWKCPKLERVDYCEEAGKVVVLLREREHGHGYGDGGKESEGKVRFQEVRRVRVGICGCWICVSIMWGVLYFRGRSTDHWYGLCTDYESVV